MDEKLCLQWNDFKENIISSVGNLKEDKDFTDVTLACEDGTQIEAHKIILSGSSPFFDNLLRRNKHSHPLIYMRGMKSEDMAAIVEFLYRGEASVPQDNLDSFLAIAEELKLKGLTGVETTEAESNEAGRPVDRRFDQFIKGETNSFKQSSLSSTFGRGSRHDRSGADGVIATMNHFSGDFKELDEKCDSMIEKLLDKFQGKAAYECKVCGKQALHKGDMRKHIEANHLEGALVSCSKCEKKFRSTNSLAVQTSSVHKK